MFKKFIKNKRGNDTVIGATILLLIVLVVGVWVYCTWYDWTQNYDITATVEKTWVDHSGDSSFYMVRTHTADGKVQILEVTRQFLNFGVNSDEIFSSLEVGHTYVFRCWGFVIESIYSYPNVIGVTEVQ